VPPDVGLGGPAPRPGRPARNKRAAEVARRVQRDIVELGWPVGTVLGAEPELLERYGVSRAVFREAVRLLEHLEVATTRRGPGGGLVVAAPQPTMVIEAVSLYLLYTGMTLEELFGARRAIEATVIELAVDRATDADIDRLRRQLAAEDPTAPLGPEAQHRLHTIIAEVARNPAAELFIDILGRLAGRYAFAVGTAGPAARRSSLEASLAAHRGIVDAVVRGDVGLARHRMDAHLDALGAWTRRRTRQTGGPPRLSPIGTSADAKMAEQVAGLIVQDVLGRGWPVGEVLGSEAEMMARFDVSRAVLREAARLLEHHQVAVMRRGPKGGLVVAAPEAAAVTDAVAIYLEYRRIEPSQLVEMRRGLELYAVERAAARIDEAGVARLYQELDAEVAEGDESSHDNLHLAIADLAGNRAVRLFTSILTQLTSDHVRDARMELDRAARAGRTTGAVDAHRAIVKALAAGDIPLARRRMQQHLDALQPFLH